MGWIRGSIIAFVIGSSAQWAIAEKITVAVAANFAQCMRALAPAFEHETGFTLVIAVGSTGKHYAQIRHGAPFDVFFAADRERPARLERDGLAVQNSRFTYAVGRLALWSPKPALLDAEGQVLTEQDFTHLAIANPRLAPYGEAAQAVLTQMELWEPLQHRLVRGENISQTLQFVKTGAAEMGFVALAQIQQPGKPIRGSYWLVPPSMHSPIEQQAVVLKSSPAATALMDFMASSTARNIMADYGYAAGYATEAE